MTSWSHSEILQAIGWAIMNSFWQMGLLYGIYLLVVQVFRPSSSTRYKFAVSSLLAGAFWAFYSFISFKVAGASHAVGMIPDAGGSNILSGILSAASIAYLGLLIFPAFRLFMNFRYVNRIQKKGLKKAAFPYRFFVQKISSQLNIKKNVSVFVSDLISSPLTIGFLKPVILLPIAALNHLSVQQVEAILLHELSHIKRMDYLVNLILNIISTVFYFNPFVKQFMKLIDEERENCCDELVLQFEYDKVGYATALFTLEKISTASHPLAIAATGKTSLKKRIEKMAGMENNHQISFRQIAGMLAAFLVLIAFNSLLLVKSSEKPDHSIAGKSIANPFLFMPGEKEEVIPSRLVPAVDLSSDIASISRGDVAPSLPAPVETENSFPAEISEAPGFRYVTADDVEGSLTTDQKEQVSSTVKATKKIMKTLQWKEIETQIGEVMTAGEKEIARLEYNEEIEKINWENIEQNLKAQYESIDWQVLNGNVNQALTMMQLDSIYNVNKNILVQLEKAEADMAKAKCSDTPFPDASVSELKKFKQEVKANLQQIQKLREKKVIRL